MLDNFLNSTYYCRSQEQQQQQGSSSSNMELQLTIMLISVAIAFLVLRLPYTVTYYLNAYKREIWVPLDIWFSYRIYVINKICDMIAVCNYGVNFFLYCLCGSSFRRRLWFMLKCGKGDKDRRASAATTTSRDTGIELRQM